MVQSPELSDEVDDENAGMEEFVEYKENQGVSDEENLEVVVEPLTGTFTNFKKQFLSPFFHVLHTFFCSCCQ